MLLLGAAIGGRRIRLRIPIPSGVCSDHALATALRDAAAARLPRLTAALRKRGIALHHTPRVRIGFQRISTLH